MTDTRTYRFADAHRPGLLLGLAPRQAVPVVTGVLFLALVLQSPLPPFVGLAGPAVGCALAFGRWRGAPLADTLVPGIRVLVARRLGSTRWTRPPLLGDNAGAVLPPALDGLELWDPPDHRFAIVRDRTAGTVTAVLRLQGQGFPLASPGEQDAMLAAWGAALSPFAREYSPVCQVVWQEWSHPVATDDHRAFLDAIGVGHRASDPAVRDYLALVDEQATVTIAHDTLVGITVDQRRVRARRSSRSRLAAAANTLTDELRLFASRLDAAGLSVDGPLSPVDLSTAVRARSDPSRAAQVVTLARSLAAAARRGALAWEPMAVEPEWSHVRVDGSYHRSYWIAAWPRLPVGADWLAGLLAEARCLRTVTVVLEPVPMGRAARAADREVMAREADGDMKERKGFRVNARERKRLADAEARERELSEGHAEFSFVGIVTISAPTVDQLDDDCADVEQAAAQSLLDLRPLDARHDPAWVASLPLGRTLARKATA